MIKPENETLIHFPAAGRYEFHIGNSIASLTYRKNEEGVFFLMAVEVPPQLEGKGVASALTEKVLEDLTKKGIPFKPVCPFIVRYIQKTPQWKALVK